MGRFANWKTTIDGGSKAVQHDRVLWFSSSKEGVGNPSNVSHPLYGKD